MRLRTRAVVGLVVAAGCAVVSRSLAYPGHHWFHFAVYLAAVLLSSGMKVGIPKSEGTMSVNFPLIFLGILQLSPLQAIALAVASVLAQCSFKVIKPFTLVQIVFNIANVMLATMLTWETYTHTLHRGLQTAPALALAATVYFFSNTVPIALIIGWESGNSPFRQWRRDFLWYLPFYLVGAALAAAADLISLTIGWLSSLLLIPIVYTMYRAYCAQMDTIRDRERHIEETEALQLRTIEGLAMAIEAKDENTHRHLLRVRVYVSELGALMQLDARTMQALQTASFLHDIGKLAVPEHIINKPGKLTPEEFEKMKIHPVVGADILERVRFPYPVVPIVRSHHEAWDGSGYPDGLKGEEIPIGARILTVVDCFDALASERPYRRAMPLDQALAFVKSRSGIQFDPVVVQLLEQHYERLEEQARHHTAEMAPLMTDFLVHRGAMPGAGFEPEQQSAAPAPATGEGEDHRRGLQNESLNLIAAASHEAKAVFELSQMLGSSLSARETSLMMSRRLQSLVPFDCLAVYLKSDGHLIPHSAEGRSARAFSSQPLPIGEGLSGWVAQSGRPLINGNPTVETNYVAESGLFTADGSALAIPLLDARGEIFGVLTAYAHGFAAFSKDHLRILQAIESKFSLALQNALRFSSVGTDAPLDYVTSLPNLRFFLQQAEAAVEKAAQRGGHPGVLVCDLNSFKSVNDRHGHLAGNRLLQMIGEEFLGCCRPGDTVARMGGDEFVFLFPSMEPSTIDRHVAAVEDAVRRACSQLQEEAGVSSAIGFAVYPKDGETPEELLGAADRRMYLRKRNLAEVLKVPELQAAAPL